MITRVAQPTGRPESTGFRVEIVPPPTPIQFPLLPAQLEQMLGLTKSTLLRWEREGVINYVAKEFNGLRLQRAYGETEFTELLVHMKGMSHRERRGNELFEVRNFPWLQAFNPTQPSEITTPSGYVIRYGERSSSEK